MFILLLFDVLNSKKLSLFSSSVSFDVASCTSPKSSITSNGKSTKFTISPIIVTPSNSSKGGSPNTSNPSSKTKFNSIIRLKRSLKKPPTVAHRNEPISLSSPEMSPTSASRLSNFVLPNIIANLVGNRYVSVSSSGSVNGKLHFWKIHLLSHREE